MTVLSIKSAIGRLFTRLRRSPLVPVLMFPVNAPGPDFSQFGILPDFDPPALIFSQMPVKHIHFVHGQDIEIFFNKYHGEKMAANIQMHTTPFKTGFIRNFDGGYAYFATSVRGYQLPQRHRSVKKTGTRTGCNPDLSWSGVKPVSLVPQKRIIRIKNPFDHAKIRSRFTCGLDCNGYRINLFKNLMKLVQNRFSGCPRTIKQDSFICQNKMTFTCRYI
jgi:hypothetical protein